MHQHATKVKSETSYARFLKRHIAVLLNQSSINMTVPKFGLHEQFGKAFGYVRHGIQLLYQEDLERLQKVSCMEKNMSCWQQRYFDLHAENERLHRFLTAKDEFLEVSMQNASISNKLNGFIQEQTAEIKNLKGENGRLRQIITELQSDRTSSDLQQALLHNATIISNLECEIEKWRRLASDNHNKLTASAVSIINLNHGTETLIQQMLRRIEINNVEGFSKFSSFVEKLNSTSNLNEEINRLYDDIKALKETCASLCLQNSALQAECKSKSEIVWELHSSQEQLNSFLDTAPTSQVANTLAVANVLLRQIKLEKVSLKSANEELRNELEIQKYRNDALDEVSRELASKVQSGTVVDLQKFQQAQQEKLELQTQLSQVLAMKELAVKKLEESEARLQKLEAKCQTLQESLDNDDQIRLKYRELFNELEESLSLNKMLKDANGELDDRLRKTKSELSTANNELDTVSQELLDLRKNYELFKDRVEIDSKENLQKFENLQAALEKKCLVEADLRLQLGDGAVHLENLETQLRSVQHELSSSSSAFDSLKIEYQDVKVKFEHMQVQNANLLSQIESLEVAKETALDIVSNTKSQLIDAESRENVLKDINQTLHAAIAKLSEQVKVALMDKQALQSELNEKNEHCLLREKEIEETSEHIKILRQQVETFKDTINRANLQHVEDAEQIETLESENKNLKVRLDKLQDVNKLLQQDLPNSQIDDSVISRERTKTKALSKQVTILKKKSKDLEKDCQRWKSLYEKEVVAKSLNA